MKFLKTAALAVALLVINQVPAWAQATNAGATAPGETVAARYGFSELRPLGVGLTIFGAAIGIGWLTKAAVESIARQPEMSGDIRTAMIISAALIEGVTFFALIILGFVLTV